MGILSGTANYFQKVEIKKFLRQLDSESNEQMSERLLMLYSTRDIRLFPIGKQLEQFKAQGFDDSVIEAGSIFIYHYQKGNELPIIGLMDLAERAGKRGLHASLRMHFYTNLATSYDGYDRLIRDMWDKLFRGTVAIRSTYVRLFPDGSLPDNRDISKQTFLDDPRSITPHFFLADSKITRDLDTRRAVSWNR